MNVLISYLKFEEDKRQGYDSWTLFADEVNKVKRILETFGFKILGVEMYPDFSCRLHLYQSISVKFLKSLQETTLKNCTIAMCD